MNQIWLDGKTFHYVLVDTNDGRDMICYGVFHGEYIPMLPEYTQSTENPGWYFSGTEELFDLTQPILEDMELILRRAEPEEAPEESTGSALVRYGPFCLLLGILGTLCRMDSGRLTKADFL